MTTKKRKKDKPWQLDTKLAVELLLMSCEVLEKESQTAKTDKTSFPAIAKQLIEAKNLFPEVFKKDTDDTSITDTVSDELHVDLNVRKLKQVKKKIEIVKKLCYHYQHLNTASLQRIQASLTEETKKMKWIDFVKDLNVQQAQTVNQASQ